MKSAVALAVLAFPLSALALDISLLNPDDPGSFVGAIFDAVKNGQVGLAFVLTLMVVLAFARKFLGSKLNAIQSDLGGTAFTFLFTVLVMVAGPLSAGAALTVATFKTAVLAAFAASGSWTFVKRVVLNFLPQLTEHVFSKIPVVGWVIGLIVKRWAAPSEPAPAYNGDGTPVLEVAPAQSSSSALLQGPPSDEPPAA